MKMRWFWGWRGLLSCWSDFLDTMQSFVGLAFELKKEGGLFEAKANWADHVVVDGNLITGQNPFGSASIAERIENDSYIHNK